MSLAVRECPGIAGMTELESPWRSLVARMAEPAYHHEYEWFLAYCRHAYPGEEDSDLRCFVVEEAGRVVAILPLETRVERIRRVPTRIWALVGSRTGDVFMMSKAADFPAENATQGARALAAVRRHLATARPRAGLLLMGRMLESGIAVDSCRGLAVNPTHAYVRGGVDSIPTDRSYKELLSSLSGKFRRNLGSRRKRFEREGRLSLVVVPRKSPEFPAAFQELLDVEASGWKGGVGTGTSIKHNHRQRKFLEELNTLDGAVQPEIYLLRVNNHCAAAQYWLRAGGVLANLKMGYDESLSRFSPGHQLLAMVLENACADAATREVSLVSHQSWHGDWRPAFRPHHWQYFRIGRVRSLLPSMLLALPTRARPGDGA